MEPWADMGDVVIYHGDARSAWQHLPESSAHAIVTSPPYFGLRDYGDPDQLGLEADPADYIEALADALTGWARVLREDGSLWLNLGDTYSTQPGWGVGGKGNLTTRSTGEAKWTEQLDSMRGRAKRSPDFASKCLLMIPERVALALIERGWILRNKVAWCKPNGMPSSVQDRLANKWEYLFHFVRVQRYHYDLDAIREMGRARKDSTPAVNWARGAIANRHGSSSILSQGWTPNGQMVNPGDWWEIATQPYSGAHFAVFPPELIRRPILATVPEGGTVLDPFFGSGTTGVEARRLGRRTVGVEISEDYCALAADRFRQGVLDVGGAA